MNKKLMAMAAALLCFAAAGLYAQNDAVVLTATEGLVVNSKYNNIIHK